MVEKRRSSLFAFSRDTLHFSVGVHANAYANQIMCSVTSIQTTNRCVQPKYKCIFQSTFKRVRQSKHLSNKIYLPLELWVLNHNAVVRCQLASDETGHTRPFPRPAQCPFPRQYIWSDPSGSSSHGSGHAPPRVCVQTLLELSWYTPT